MPGFHPRDSTKVPQKTFTPFNLPAVLPLVDRDDEGRACGREPLGRDDGVGFDIGEGHGRLLLGPNYPLIWACVWARAAALALITSIRSLREAADGRATHFMAVTGLRARVRVESIRAPYPQPPAVKRCWSVYLYAGWLMTRQSATRDVNY